MELQSLTRSEEDDDGFRLGLIAQVYVSSLPKLQACELYAAANTKSPQNLQTLFFSLMNAKDLP